MQRNNAGEECSWVWVDAMVLRIWSLDLQHLSSGNLLEMHILACNPRRSKLES